MMDLSRLYVADSRKAIGSKEWLGDPSGAAGWGGETREIQGYLQCQAPWGSGGSVVVGGWVGGWMDGWTDGCA